MTIKLTEDELDEQFQETDKEALQWDSSDGLDVTYKFVDTQISQGWSREISLRENIHIEISQAQNKDCVIISHPETENHYIGCQFMLSGDRQWRVSSALSETLWTFAGGKYLLNSTGSRDQLVAHYGLKPWSLIRLDVHQSLLRSFTASPEEELPQHLQYLVKPVNQEIQRRVTKTQPIMNTVLQQILHCPYQGIVKRAYLESKVIELMALVLDHEIVIQQGEVKKVSLKPEQIERIHYAKEILLRDMNNPPSLEELAHQAGLNDFMLKQGFRQVFNTTVFGELRSHRLEVAKQLLAEQDITVTEVAKLVGYVSMRSFARAFRRQFGISPKQHQKACRKY